MRFLALDPSSSSCGYAYWDTEVERVEFAYWVLSKPNQMLGDGGRNVHHALSAMHHRQPFETIFCEEIRTFRGMMVSQITLYRMFEVYLHIHSWGREMGIPVHSYNNQQWRKSFIGITSRGTVRKQFKDMSIRRARHLGFHVTIDDEADAIGVLTHGALGQGVQPYWLRDAEIRAQWEYEQRERRYEGRVNDVR